MHGDDVLGISAGAREVPDWGPCQKYVRYCDVNFQIEALTRM